MNKNKIKHKLRRQKSIQYIAEKCWIDLFMSQDRRSYFTFWSGKIPGNLLCWNMKLFPPFNPLLLSYIAHLCFIVSHRRLVLLHCNHLPSHQLTWWKLQVKLQYMFYWFLCPDKSLQMNVGKLQPHVSPTQKKRNSKSEHSTGKLAFYV